jgi:hypothetical protein
MSAEWPPDPAQHPRTAAAWVALEAFVVEHSPVAWPEAVHIAMAAGPLGDTSANQLVTRACTEEAFHWSGTREKAGRWVHHGRSADPFYRRKAPSMARRKPTDPLRWSNADLRAVADGLERARKRYEALGIDRLVSELAVAMLTDDRDNGSSDLAEGQPAPTGHRANDGTGSDQQEQPESPWGAG